MLSAPGQNWKLYEERCRAEHIRWLQGLTSTESLAIFESLHNWAAAHSENSPRAGGLEDTRWKEKLSLRRRMCREFAELDRFRGISGGGLRNG